MIDRAVDSLGPSDIAGTITSGQIVGGEWASSDSSIRILLAAGRYHGAKCTDLCEV